MHSQDQEVYVYLINAHRIYAIIGSCHFALTFNLIITNKSYKVKNVEQTTKQLKKQLFTNDCKIFPRNCCQFLFRCD